MGAHSPLVRDCHQFGDLRGCVDGAVIGRNRQRQHRRLRVVRVAPPSRVQRVPKRVGSDPEVVATDATHDGTSAEHRGRATLALQDVGGFVTQDGAPRRAQRSQRQRVGGSAADDGEHLGIGMFEHLADLVAKLRRPVVGAVRQSRAHVGRRDRRHDLGCGAGGVVATELDVRIHPVRSSGSAAGSD